MKFNKLIAPVLLFAALIVMHKSIWHTFFIYLNFSWTASFIVPYVLQVAAAVLLAISLNGILKKRNVKLSKPISILALIVCLSIGFWANPIFEGDISNDLEMVHLDESQITLNEGLTMVALPGCKHCGGMIPSLNFLQVRNPSLKVQVAFVQDSEEMIDAYKGRLLPEIAVFYTEKPKLIAELVGGRFPGFLFKSKDGSIVRWQSKGFGTRALDWIESSSKK